METNFFLFINFIISSMVLNLPPFVLLKFKYNFNKYYAYVAIVLFDILISLPKTLGGMGPTMLHTVVTCTIPIIWSILLFQDSLWRRIIVPVGFTICVIFPLEFITMFFMYYFWDSIALVDIYINNDIYFAGSILNTLLYYITEIFIILLWKRFIDKKKISHAYIYIIIALYQSILFVLWLRIPKNNFYLTMLGGLLLETFGILINLMFFYIFNQMQEKLATEEKLTALYRQRDFEKEYYKASQQHLKQMQHLQKKFISHIRELRAAINQPNNEKNIQQIIAQSQIEINSNKHFFYSSHPVINALLTVKQNLAENRNITMEIHCTHSSDIGITDVDICSVLGNLLDNALEACDKTEQIDKKVSVDISEKAGFFIIKVANSITSHTPKFKGIGYTSKADTENHGLGLRMVERICSKYDGKLILSPSQETMYVSAILQKNVT